MVVPKIEGNWLNIVISGGLCINWSDAKWPQEGGMLDYNTLLQLLLFLRREGKWDEVSYTDVFFVLQDKPEWQKDCGLVPPQDPMVLALGRVRD